MSHYTLEWMKWMEKVGFKSDLDKIIIIQPGETVHTDPIGKPGDADYIPGRTITNNGPVKIFMGPADSAHTDKDRVDISIVVKES